MSLSGKRVLLIISGGIAAYKVLELIRRGREQGLQFRAVMTRGAQEFITPLSVAALTEEKVYSDLFSLTDEAEMGHIRLSREADLLLVAPASADIMARAAAGLCDDLATTALLASDKPILMAPSMNVMMWNHPATQANVATLRRRGVMTIGPGSGDMACGETGSGRMAEPLEILSAIDRFFAGPVEPALTDRRLAGVKALVTSGPTREPIDPVRYMSNHSSGKQGHAIAAALQHLGASVTLVSGPVEEAAPPGVQLVPVETAQQMMKACEAALPADIAICAAAVADWRVADAGTDKIKKQPDGAPPALRLIENPDILARLSNHPRQRPRLVVGFAAETGDLLDHARAKLAAKGCDWIVANLVGGDTGTFGGERNRVHLVMKQADGRLHEEAWPEMTKAEVASRLADAVAQALPHGAPG